MPTPSATPRLPERPAGYPRRRVAVVALGLTLLAAAGLIAWHLVPRPETPAPAEEPTFPPPPVSSSPYRNTTAAAHYVGSKACTRCHEAETESYRETGMGRSLALVTADNSPPDGTVDHLPSGRRYRVYRKDGRLHHRELLGASGTEEVELSDYPVKYVVGSGRHALTYVVEVDGFLVESPVTWYASRKRWDMSPGYDKPDQLGFERPITEACLLCHAGWVQPLDRSVHRFGFHELTIGCERCHGPGSLHLGRQNRPGQKPKPGGGPVDDTIVDPGRLPRDLAEAVCEQCHLQSQCMVPVRGRWLSEFRPGLPLQDFRLDYAVRRPDAPMKVTGHVEQMHASACYQKSSNLTCMTCHNPHGFPRPEKRLGYYRAICQNCHEHKKPCTDPAARDAKNGCVKCHMPTGATDIPHLAFTHHRIGFHPERRQPPSSADPDVRDPDFLQPVHDLSRLGELDRKRSLGVAYLQLSSVQRDARLRQTFMIRAVSLLHEVREAGLQDPIVDSALCRLSFGQDPESVVTAAKQALAHLDLPAMDRCDAMYILADAYFRQHQYQEAVAVLKELNRLRRHLPYWLLLANCYQQLGDREDEVLALEQAATINPTLEEVRERLAVYHEQKGDRERAEYHRRRVLGDGR